DDKLTRRDFVVGSGKLALGAMIVPRHVLGGPGYQAPSDTMNIAIVGFGGQGAENAEVLAATENIVAVCDLDFGFSEGRVKEKLKDSKGNSRPEGIRLHEKFAKARRYTDFREMLDKQKDIDGVVIATPDHLHAVIAAAAMRAGKHVYVQKPLTYSVHEARLLRDLALSNPRLVTQMGNQGHSSDGARLINEWIQAGIIGLVRDVHVWTNRPVVYWPQGVPRPTGGPIPLPTGTPFGNTWSPRYMSRVLAAAMGSYRVPDGFRWDLYLGPVAEDVPYHPIYHPFNWRGWLGFGVGALGDMGAHLIDHPFWALGLTHPTSIEATSTPWGTMQIPADPGAAPGTPGASARSQPVSYPVATAVHYQFPARGAQPPIRLSWYDGGLYPARPDVLPDDIVLKSEGGVIFVGDKGILMNDTYGSNPRLFPVGLMEDAALVPKSYSRITWSHELNWVKACKGEAKASSPIEYAAQLTETMLLGVVALRTGQGRKLLYDAERMAVTNIPEANQYLTREYRTGWSV
ncbi:MAG TPA: Gfo/Idh/MocA family oxidoreductase, partial [Candidatus Elarobacter sp.]|nr:Gfo/Idh/MocA family oxidoreductase [Candidatus Elarobacter sp.]